jgi:di/tricarboxylate transporter
MVIKDDSPLVDRPLDSLRQTGDPERLSALLAEESTDEPAPIDTGFDLDVLQLARNDEQTISLDSEEPIAAGDVLTVRGNPQEVNRFSDTFALRQLHRKVVTEADIQPDSGRGHLVEVSLPEGSRLVGDTIEEANLAAYHNAIVLALRSGDSIIREGLSEHELEVGDSILLQVRERDLRYLVENRDVIGVRGIGPTEDEERPSLPELSRDTPLAVGILATVVLVGAFQIVPIVIAALGGVLLMFVFDVIRPREAYRAVGWNVVFLLAGVIPLGTALQVTGGVEYITSLIVGVATVIPPLAVIALFYILTNLFSNIITPVATVVLFAPIAVDTASRLGLNEFSFLLSILFAASTAFMTPIGYQTNMMVYGPGGYRFTDYLLVGAPLQLLLTVVTTLGIALFWGV